MLGDTLAEVVLCYDIDGELPLFDFDVGMLASRLEQTALDFLAGIVFVVKDAEFRVAALAVQVEAFAAAFAVEIHTVLHQFAYAVRSFADGHFDHLAVTDAVAGHQGVVDMLVERVAVVHHGGDATLCIACRAFSRIAFGQDANFAVGSHLKCETQASNT